MRVRSYKNLHRFYENKKRGALPYSSPSGLIPKPVDPVEPFRKSSVVNPAFLKPDLAGRYHAQRIKTKSLLNRPLFRFCFFYNIIV